MGRKIIGKVNRQKSLEKDLLTLQEWIGGWDVEDADLFLSGISLVRHSDKITETGHANLASLQRLEQLLLEVVRTDYTYGMDQLLTEAHRQQSGVGSAFFLLICLLSADFYAQPIDIQDSDFNERNGRGLWSLLLSNALVLFAKLDQLYGPRDTHLFFDTEQTAPRH